MQVNPTYMGLSSLYSISHIWIYDKGWVREDNVGTKLKAVNTSTYKRPESGVLSHAAQSVPRCMFGK